MALNRMYGLWWIDPKGQSLLDVGCNVGELLIDAASRMPAMRLAGVDVNATAIAANSCKSFIKSPRYV